MTIYFTSDLHFYHKNVIKFCNRPFRTKNPFFRLWEWWTGNISEASVKIMNEALIANWNAVVKPEDTVYCLGDVSMAFRPIELYSHRLNGKKFLVPGNHDFCHSYHKKGRRPDTRQKWIKLYQDNGWIILPEQITVVLPDLGEIQLCHHPRIYDEPNPAFTDKFERWRPAENTKDSIWLLHGHTHSRNQLNLQQKMIDVGVDANNYTPVSLETIKLWIDSERVF